jgi:hypothetical protein
MKEMKPDISIIVLKGLKKDMGRKMVGAKKSDKDKENKPKKSALKIRLEKIRGK